MSAAIALLAGAPLALNEATATQEPFQARLTIDGQVTELQSGALTVFTPLPMA